MGAAAAVALSSSSSSEDIAPFASASSLPVGDLRLESVRLKTFAKWPLDFIRPADLAQAGFYYTGSRDSVRCVFCG